MVALTREELRRWRAVHDYGQKNSRAIRALDLSVDNNSPVLWFGTGVVPSSVPKPNQSLSSRKKHV